ncbi:hypothetical protein [Streptomyces lavendofoliae]|uniref:hypothetical protein n=1 Tax=Streptomyces lavendofoliae TaxID=67314 RepID=UPI003D8EE52F
MAVMNGPDRRRVWIYALWVIGAIAVAVISVFTMNATVGGSSNNCVGAVCGDDSDGNVVYPATSPAPAAT